MSGWDFSPLSSNSARGLLVETVRELREDLQRLPTETEVRVLYEFKQELGEWRGLAES